MNILMYFVVRGVCAYRYPDLYGLLTHFRELCCSDQSITKGRIKMKPFVKIAVVLVLIVLVGVLVTQPYFTMKQIEKAINTRDAVKLAENIDFPSLRSNLKDQLTASIMKTLVTEDDPFAIFGMALASTLIDGLVEVILTPNGLTALLSGVELESIDQADVSNNEINIFEHSRWTFENFSAVSLWVSSDTDEQIRFVLQRQGLKWRLCNIILPI